MKDTSIIDGVVVFEDEKHRYRIVIGACYHNVHILSKGGGCYLYNFRIVSKSISCRRLYKKIKKELKIRGIK